MARYTAEQVAEYNRGLERGRRNQMFGGGYGPAGREQDLWNEHPGLYRAWSAGWDKGNDTTSRIELLKK